MIHEEKLAKYVDANLEIKQCKVNGYRVNYIVAGSGRPLILLHGLNMGWGSWYRNIAAFSKYYKVYALDLPGSGGSSKIDFATANLQLALVETVSEFIKKHGLHSSAMIGHSIGAWVIIRVALKEKDLIGQMVLVDPLGLTDYVPLRYMPVTISWIARFLATEVVKPTKEKMAGFLAGVCFNMASIEEQFVDYYVESIFRERLVHPFGVMNRLFDPFHLKREFVLLPEVNMIQNPILIINGERDFIIPHRRVSNILNLFKNAKMELMTNSGHVPFIENSFEFNKIALEFLSESR